jgi:hypothetical protein
MPTDHQITEDRPSRFERKSGMVLTALTIIAVLGIAMWAMMR